MSPGWEFSEYLAEMDHPRAKEILNKIKRGKYQK